jgi:hypothetical protein
MLGRLETERAASLGETGQRLNSAPKIGGALFDAALADAVSPLRFVAPPFAPRSGLRAKAPAAS